MNQHTKQKHMSDNDSIFIFFADINIGKIIEQKYS